MLGTAILMSLAFVLVWLLQKLHDKIKRLPPGPFRFPLIGCMIQILWAHTTLPFIGFQKLAKVYGPIMYIQIGVVKAVVINGYEANKEILSSDDWIGRNQVKWQTERTFGKPIGLICADVDHWKETRRFCVKTLREFGFGVKKHMEVHIAEQADDLCGSIRKQIKSTQGILEIENLFEMTVLNSAWTMITGQTFKLDDPKLNELIGILKEFFLSCSIGAGLLTAYPFLVDYAPKLVKFDKQQSANGKFQQFFRSTISEIRAERVYKDNPSTFIEVFLQKIDEVQKSDPGNTIYCDENLISVLYDFFIGATETTSNTLNFSVLYLILNPAVQEKVADEIYQVVGNSRFAVADDKAKMPYTEATILECFRMASVVPIGPRKLHVDAKFGPYEIPKGTTVFPNYWSVCRDETIWSDPDTFRPERFLNQNGNVIKAEKIMPFAIGKRNCIGENVAKATYFILLTGLLQQFRLEINLDRPKPKIDPNLGISLSPIPFSFVVKERQ